jgi:hypothetical protein
VVEAGALRLQAANEGFERLTTGTLLRDAGAGLAKIGRRLLQPVASSRITSRPMVGKSMTIRRNKSLAIFSVVTRLSALIVAVRGTSQRMPMSPIRAFLPREATTKGPRGESTITSVEPSTTM